MSASPSPSRVRSRRGEATRARIAATALQLFARRGIDAVSLNEIVHEAGVNNAAIHYHFGSKEGLVAAILEQGARRWGARRDALLDELDDEEHPDPRAVVAAMVLPTTELAATEEGRDHLRLVSAVAAHPQLAPLVMTTSDRYTTRYLAVLERATPDLTRVERLRRYGLARAWLYHALAVSDGPLRSWLSAHGVDPAVPGVDDTLLVDTLLGVMSPTSVSPPANRGGTT